MKFASKRPKFSEKRNDVILVQDRISKTSKVSLRPALRCRRITPWSTGVRPVVPNTVFINFGGGEIPIRPLPDSIVLNSPDKVAISSNKLRTFELLKAADVPHVRWTVDKGEVTKWLDKGHKVLARRSLSSSGGRAISVLERLGGSGGGEQLVEAPLYTRYFPKTHEFRVHVVDGKAIDLTEKKLREGLKERREQVAIVRSHGNGWVHAHGDLAVSREVDLQLIKTLAIDAIRAVGLDFGAVDILACLDASTPRALTKAVVCEVNSAPGIENEVTRNAYVKALNELIDQKKGKAA